MSVHRINDYINSPFKFLDAYELKDSKVFFGRKKETDQLYKMVYKTNMLMIYGESGTGKTSLVQCGLASRFEGPDWLPFFIRRRENINESIQETLDVYIKKAVVKEAELTEKIAYLNSKYFRPVYLIFDQFEELFILGTKEEQAKFIQDIKSLVDSKLACKVLFVMREEYISQLYEFEKVIPAIFDFRLRVEPMNRLDVAEVIKKSFAKFNIRVAKGATDLVEDMIDNISGKEARIQLPYLQIYLDKLYREHYKARYKNLKYLILPPLIFKHSIVEKIGNIDDILQGFLLQSRDDLQVILTKKYPDISKTFVHDLLNEFVTEEGTKRPVKYTIEDDKINLDKKIKDIFPNTSNGIFTEVIEILKGDRIIRDNDNLLELAHDSLAKLIDEQRTDEQKIRNTIFQKLKNTRLLYEKTEAYLSKEDLLLINQNLFPTQLVDYQEFIEKSEFYHKEADKLEKLKAKEDIEKEERRKRAELEAEEAEKRRQLEQNKNVELKKKSSQIRKWAGVAFVLAGLASCLAWFAYENYKKAESEKDIAVVEQKKADSLSIQLAIANHTSKIKTAENYKYRGLYAEAIETIDSITSKNIGDTIINPPKILTAYKKEWKEVYAYIQKANQALGKSSLPKASELYITAFKIDTLKPYQFELTAQTVATSTKNNWLEEKIFNTQKDMIRNIESYLRQGGTWVNNCECNLAANAYINAKRLKKELKKEYMNEGDVKIAQELTNEIEEFRKKKTLCQNGENCR